MTPFVCPVSRHKGLCTPCLAAAILGVGFFALLSILPIAAARATPATVAEIATYDGADRQSVLEAGAKQEGALLLYSTGTQLQPLMDRFTQKYPYVHVELLRADPE